MATNRENNLKMPVLWEIATLYGYKIEFDNRRDRSGNLALMIEQLADLYHLNESERKECYRKSGRKKFELEVRRTLDILQDVEGALVNKRYESWTITNKGLVSLRAFCATMLRELPSSEAQQFLASRDENGQDFFVNALRCVSPNEVSTLSQAASSYLDLFIKAIEHLPLDKLGGFLSSVHHRRELLLARHIASYRGSSREPYESIAAAKRLLRSAKQ